MKHFLGVSSEGTKEDAVAVHDDEAVFVVRLEELIERFSVKLVVAKVEAGVDGLEGLKVDVDLLLLALLSDNSAGVHNKAIGGAFGVKLEALLGGCDGSKN